MKSNPAEIGQIAITVSDVAKVLTFYRDILGLELLFNAGPNLAFLSAGSVRVMLSTPQGAGSAGANSVLYFNVSDIEGMHGAMVSSGAISAHHSSRRRCRITSYGSAFFVIRTAIWLG